MTVTDRDTASLTITVRTALLDRVDAMAEEIKTAAPYATATRSQVIAHALGEWFAMLDNPHKEVSAPSAQHRERRP